MFKKPFSFDGRIRRAEYGLSLFIYIILAVIIRGISSEGDLSVFILGYIPILWFFLAQGAKRCHDLGKNGWWQLIPFYVFLLLFNEGQTVPNQYGENPKSKAKNISNKEALSSSTTLNSVNISTMIVPDVCQHCKNPNTKRIRLCEWCGNQIC
jgi:uncharacterized membrane protein YhaH (DUF805 family)